LKNWVRNLLKGGTSQPRNPFQGGQALSHERPSSALFYSQFFALMVADERGSDRLEPRDALAGIYIASAEFDGLLRYWSDRGHLERLVKSECGSLNPRLFYWCWGAERWRDGPRHRLSFASQFKKISPELDRVLVSASDFASRRDRGSSNAHVVVPEDVLLAIVRLEDLPISRSLLESGLNVAQLEREVGGCDPDRNP
jgi:hypothetical protein